MKIKAFILTFNEADIIAFTVKHYQNFCQEVHIYDNYSTDDTVKICAAMGCIIHKFGIEGVLDDREYLKVKNNCWKDHRNADYVIVCDADEIFSDKQSIINSFASNAFLYRCIGYQCYSEELPYKYWGDNIKYGFLDPMYDKVIMFNPKVVQEINYGYGCHGAKPTGPYAWVVSDRKLYLYHMKYVGGVDRMIARYNMYRKRMCEFNLINNLGRQYCKTEFDIIKDWNEVKQKST